MAFCVYFDKFISDLSDYEQNICLDECNGLMCIMCCFYAERKVKSQV